MTTRFVQVSWGLQYTDTFLHIDTIKAYIQSYQRGQPVSSSISIAESIASSAQDRMNEEIHQHIRISNSLAKEELFDYLTGWIDYFERNLMSSKNIRAKINQYNEMRLKEYDEIVIQEEEKFKQTENYKKLNHLDFYEVISSSIGGFGYLGTQRFFGAPNRLEQYRKFFSAPDPDLIDIDYLPKYYTEIVKPFLSRCINIAAKRLSYLKGENAIKSLPDIPIKQQPEIHTDSTSKSQQVKLKTTLTSGQILYLFKALLEVKAIEPLMSNVDICRFIAGSISSKDMATLSPDSLARKWSNIDINDIAFWYETHPEIAKLVIRDNPNKLKYKVKKIK